MTGHANPSLLLGPADADHYRVKIGRYKDRWYTDPLPGDDVAPAAAPDAAWPAFSTVKGASSPSWNMSQSVAIKRIARAYRDNPSRLAGLDERDTIATLSMWNEGDLSRAGDRGTAIHHYIDNVKLRGLPPMMDLSAAQPWIPAVDAFFAAYGPQIVAAEIVVIHRHLNGMGYGGTIDAVVLIQMDGRRYLVDWKSRGGDSDHAAYPVEAAQVSAYANAEYAIVDRGGHPVRMPVDELGIDGGLIVSIRPDGCEVYPIDLGVGFEHFTALHSWWVAQRTDGLAIGRPWAPVGVAADNGRHLHAVKSAPVVAAPATVPGVSGVSLLLPPAARRERLIARIGELVNAGHGPRLLTAWPPGVPGLTASTHTDDELAAILATVQRVSDEAGLPWHDDEGIDSSVARHPSNERETTPLRVAPISPVEGAEVDAATLAPLARRFNALDEPQRALVRTVASHAAQAGRSFSLTERATVRRYEIGRAVVCLVEATWRTGPDGNGSWSDEFVRAAIRVAAPTIDVGPTVPLGAALSLLTADEAVHVTDIAMAVGTDSLVVDITPEGYVLSGLVVDGPR